jgi:hypothetical protein
VKRHEAMPAPRDPSKAVVESRRPDLQALIANERDMLAKRIADAPAAWISIPMWGRVFVTTRRLLGLDRRSGRR